MKKNYFVVATVFIALVLMVTGVIVGSSHKERSDHIDRAKTILYNTAKEHGYVNLGVIDGTAISKRNGMTYDGQAIMKELFNRNGMITPENSWSFYDIGETEGVTLVRLVTYKGPVSRRTPRTQQRVDKVYVYGVY